ncbi:hypothetical protein ACLI07_23415 (plasmid) [Providencia huaxiensis]|uniref:Uncharacterized protein n=7 Tax=Enterobacterales TaxID=91347 RepID=A0A7L8KA60_ECOLX|nr:MULTISPECIES: hypothetical protein [Enterobacterales]ELY4881455.1 hypothetical protein [Morganella morganii]SPY66657.1 Uncharacterised protein [Providencia stuartii]ELR5094254.1 hypothetical protein [Providencia rettgeri]ELR5243102.1 hypothetical protein [Providencia rettgeri]ELR5280429.1 hypothetical protein [Providencia rettgeri]
MTQSVIDKVREALAARNLTLVSSLSRIIVLLPELGRVNVLVRRDDGLEDTATLLLDESGVVSVLLSEEGENVRFLPRSGE